MDILILILSTPIIGQAGPQSLAVPLSSLKMSLMFPGWQFSLLTLLFSKRGTEQGSLQASTDSSWHRGPGVNDLGLCFPISKMGLMTPATCLATSAGESTRMATLLLSLCLG